MALKLVSWAALASCASAQIISTASKVCDANTDGNPMINVEDLLNVLAAYGQTCQSPGLKVTELYSGAGDSAHGSNGKSITEDWFELTNLGTTTVNLNNLYYHDADGGNIKSKCCGMRPLTGVQTLAPGESAVFVLTENDPKALAEFKAAWPGVKNVGWVRGDSKGLGKKGDAVFIYDTTGIPGWSYSDLTVASGKQDGMKKGGCSAAQHCTAAFKLVDTLAYGKPLNIIGHTESYSPIGLTSCEANYKPKPSTYDPNIPEYECLGAKGTPMGVTSKGDKMHTASPGMCPKMICGPTPKYTDLIVTEMYSGGASKATADWFELTNPTNQPISLANTFYDDASAKAGDKIPLVGVPSIPAGKSAVFVLDKKGPAAGIKKFEDAWGKVPGALLGAVWNGKDTGSGLGGKGDAVNIFRGSKIVAQLAYTKNRADHWNTYTAKAFSVDKIDCARPSFVPKGKPAVVGSPFYYNFNSLASGVPPLSCPPKPPTPAWLSVASPVCTKGCAGWPVPTPWKASDIKITEVYSGSGNLGKHSEDWIEVTNFGKVAISTAGWYYDDDSADPTKDVKICGTPTKTNKCPPMVIQPGKSIVIVIETEKHIAPLRKNWKVPASVTVGYADGSGLGGNGDAAHLFNSNLKVGTVKGNIKSAEIANFKYSANQLHPKNGHSITLTDKGYSKTPCAWVIPKGIGGADHTGSPGKYC